MRGLAVVYALIFATMFAEPLAFGLLSRAGVGILRLALAAATLIATAIVVKQWGDEWERWSRDVD